MIKGWCETCNFLCLIQKVVESNVCCGHKYKHYARMCSSRLDEPPKITIHPRSLKEISPDKPVLFTVQATGTDPLSYHWQWNPTEEEEWQSCPAEWSDGATLTIPSVQKSNEGSYCCVVSNYAGNQTSNPAQLSVGKNPAYIGAYS